tara:strand:+ start:1002 stop:1163 length:162 start_codon:yes stop_codon:yes gene_type:complete
VVNGILQVTNQIFQNIEIGVVVTVTLHFLKTLQEIGKHLVIVYLGNGLKTKNN